MIYVASKTRHAPMWLRLREQNYPICSTWIDEAEQGQTKSFSELWERITREVNSASCVLFYLPQNGERHKGTLVEVGIALSQDKSIFVLCPGWVSPEDIIIDVGTWIHHPNVRIFFDKTLRQGIDEAYKHDRLKAAGHVEREYRNRYDRPINR